MKPKINFDADTEVCENGLLKELAVKEMYNIFMHVNIEKLCLFISASLQSLKYKTEDKL